MALTLPTSLIKPQTITQLSSVCLCVSLDHHSVALAHLWICCTTQTLPFSGKHLLVSMNLADSLLLLARNGQQHGTQTCNTSQPHQPFCSLVKFRHNDTSTATSLPDVPTCDNSIEMSSAGHTEEATASQISDCFHRTAGGTR
jgi:hypothetical protein